MNKSSHAFGSIKNLAAAIEAGKINARDIVFFDEGKIGWLDKEGKLVMLEDDTKFEIVSAPAGTLVNYGENEIRIMCPADTVWTKQNVGTNGLPNRYYITFRAYAPKNAVSFKEDIKLTIEDDTMWYFENNSSAGIDEYGRKYSTIWWSVAEYDESTDTWTYFGAESTADNCIGKDYSVEWYDENGTMIGSDYVRLSYTNESCHRTDKPYYAHKMIEEAKKYTDEQVANASITIVEF